MSIQTLRAAIVLVALVFGGAVATVHAEVPPARDSTVTCPIGREPLTTNILLRVFPLRIGTEHGTAFTLELKGRQYIVTAKHLFQGDMPATVEIALDDWTTLPVALVGRGRGKHDVLVLATDRQVSVTFPVEVGIRGLMLGQSVRFLGYFHNVTTSPLPGHKRRGAPLVMSGIVSGFNYPELEDEGSSLWIDGHNNMGFSGGPVVFQPATARSAAACRWRIAGVISGYAPAPIEVTTITGWPTAAVAISNAGLLRAIPIETVRDLIMKNPIGFQLDQ